METPQNQSKHLLSLCLKEKAHYLVKLIWMVLKSGVKNSKVKIKEFFLEYAHLFALESLDMGHTFMVKHKIKLDNYT